MVTEVVFCFYARFLQCGVCCYNEHVKYNIRENPYKHGIHKVVFHYLLFIIVNVYVWVTLWLMLVLYVSAGSVRSTTGHHWIDRFVQIYHFPWVWGTGRAESCDCSICSNLPFSVGLRDSYSTAMWLTNLFEFTIFRGSGGRTEQSNMIAQFDRIYHFPWVWGTATDGPWHCPIWPNLPFSGGLGDR